jgi:hypothetical protein
MRRYFAFAARTPVLLTSLALALLILFGVFPALPIGAELLDVRDGYSYPELIAAMQQYGASGRRVYALASPTVDTLFPASYVTFFCGLLYRLRPLEGLWVVAWVPLFAGIWDLCENAQITAMLLMYPALGETQVAWASFFTHVKTVYIGPAYQLPAIAFVLIALLQGAMRRWTR